MRQNRTRGFALMAASSLLISLMSVLARLTRGMEGLSAFSTSFFRFAIGGAAVAAWVFLSGRSLRPRRPLLLLIRGLLGSSAMVVYFHAIVTIGLAKASILIYTAPIWAAAFAPFATRESPSIRLWGCVLSAFGGLYLLLFPSGGFGGVSTIDAAALGAGVLGGLAILVVKRLSAVESAPMIFLGLAAVGALTTSVPALNEGAAYSTPAWGLLVGIGVCGAAAKILDAAAFRHISGTEGALWSMLAPAANCAAGALAFQETFTARMAFGSAVVLAACGAAAVFGRAKQDAQ